MSGNPSKPGSGSGAAPTEGQKPGRPHFRQQKDTIPPEVFAKWVEAKANRDKDSTLDTDSHPPLASSSSEGLPSPSADSPPADARPSARHEGPGRLAAQAMRGAAGRSDNAASIADESASRAPSAPNGESRTSGLERRSKRRHVAWVAAGILLVAGLLWMTLSAEDDAGVSRSSAPHAAAAIAPAKPPSAPPSGDEAANEGAEAKVSAARSGTRTPAEPTAHTAPAPERAGTPPTRSERNNARTAGGPAAAATIPRAAPKATTQSTGRPRPVLPSRPDVAPAVATPKPAPKEPGPDEVERDRIPRARSWIRVEQ